MSRPWAINAGLRSRREPPETMFFLENFLTREASYKPLYLISCSQSGPDGTVVALLGRQKSKVRMVCREDKADRFGFGVWLRRQPSLCDISGSPLPDTGRPQRAWAGFPGQVVEKSWRLRIATQRRTQAALAIDFVDSFAPERSLRNGFTAYT